MKKPLVIVLIVMAALVVSIAAGAVMLTACSNDKTEEKKAKPPEPIANPLTGVTVDEGFDQNAAGKRIVAFVVENSPDARPQWGMDDPNYDPDIIVQGEVEGGITRMLWLYADYNHLPEIIGPMRSARPPFIRFSEFWDAIFIHWGQSHSAGEYVGANEVFKTDVVEHINQMSFSNECGMFDRDHTRNVSAEHTGIVHGDKVEAALIEDTKSKKSDPYTKLLFYKKPTPVSDAPAKEVDVDYSTRTDWETTKWTYNEEDHKYYSDNFKNDVRRDNLLILYSDTEYITKNNYQGPGGASSVTYCDYSMAGGKGKLISQGTVKDIEWKKDNDFLILIDVEATKAAQAKAEEEGTDKATEDGEEPEPIVVQAKLNKGKTWIGWISNNNGGKVEVIADSSEGGSDSDDSSDSETTPAPTEVDGDAE